MATLILDLISALELLDEELALRDESRILVACGGGVLSIMGIISRQTRDLDIITPELDGALLECAGRVANKLGLDVEWLNNGPSGFIRDLEKGWEFRTEIIFSGKCLTIQALGRRDFIATKLQGLCDRDEFDLEDILALKPKREEIESLKSWLLFRDTSELWPKRVESQLQKLLERISNG